MRWTGRVERLLLVIGLLMLAIYVGASIHEYVLSRAEVMRFKSQQLLAQEVSGGAKSGSKSPDFDLWSAKRIQGYEESLAAHFAPSMALLEIPKIHLEVPVLEGTDDLSLNRAVGHIAGTAKPGEKGNIGIAGHRDGFFRGLKDVGSGDEIEIVTAKETMTYVVDQVTIVNPNDVWVLTPRSDTPTLTLVTCYPFYYVGSAPQRYIVQATRTESTATNVSRSDDTRIQKRTTQ
jgi:sortase A